ncbi:hypothetical protein WDU94_003285 [Cyamophila willieti]
MISRGTYLYLPFMMATMFYLCTCGEDSTGTKWIEVEVVKNTTDPHQLPTNWTDLDQFNGNQLCDGDQKGCTRKFAEYIRTVVHKCDSVRSECQTDAQVEGNKMVCWIRQKETQFNLRKRTIFEVQFWTDNRGSHCRYAVY